MFVLPGETPERLWRDKLAPLGVRLTLKVLEDLAAGRIVARRQDEACATWEPSWTRPPLARPDLDLIGRCLRASGSRGALDPVPVPGLAGGPSRRSYRGDASRENAKVGDGRTAGKGGRGTFPAGRHDIRAPRRR